MRENFAGCGKMILGSDSHTRYGALGTTAIGEGGGELDKQLLGDTYDIAYPDVVAIYLTGAPRPGVGPMDVALAIVERRLQVRIREEQGHGVRRPRHRVASHRLPQRHRRHDDRNHLPEQRLADRW